MDKSKKMLGNFPFVKLLEKKNWLFVLGLAGIILIGISDLLTGGGVSARDEPVQVADVSLAEEAMEKRLETLLAQVEGAGEVQVMVTLEDAGQTIYAQDQQSQTQEQQSQTGTSRSVDRTSEHILFDGANGRQALVESQLEPEVKGVAIVCTGAGDILVVGQITDLVATVLDVPTNRICVAKMI